MNVFNEKKAKRIEDINRFVEYHKKYPTHGYRWLNAKIKLDLGIIMSDNYAQRCCAYAGIRSISKRCKYTKPGQKYKIYPNLLLADLAINQPFQVVVSDMTAFWVHDTYYELTLYMDLFNNEIVSYGLAATKGDRNTYFNGLEKLIEKKKEYKDLYLPKKKPSIIRVPKMNYLSVCGNGNPNEPDGDYHKSIELLYGIAYTLRMSYKTDHKIDGFFEYVVPPLEGFWWQDGIKGMDYIVLLAFAYILLKVCGKMLRYFLSPETTVFWLVVSKHSKKYTLHALWFDCNFVPA